MTWKLSQKLQANNAVYVLAVLSTIVDSLPSGPVTPAGNILVAVRTTSTLGHMNHYK